MSKWIKIGGMLLVAALLVTALGGFALAQAPQGDGDGVRDLSGTGVNAGMGPAWGFVDEDGDGINDRWQADPQFVDKDGDGICDLCGATAPSGATYGPGYRFSDGTAMAGAYGRNQANPAFVDKDGDGVCDYYGQYTQQRAMGRGRWAAGR